VLTIPPASARDLMPPPAEAAHAFSATAKKAWFAVYTASRHEKLVHAQFIAKRIQSFLPLYRAVRRWKNGVRREVEHPLLPGYVFARLGVGEQLPVLQTLGVVHIVGNGTSPLPLDDHEMHALRIGAERASLVPRSFPGAGDTVRITRGPFRGVKGVVDRTGDDLMFVVSIRLIQRSFAVRVQSADIEPAI
jgi:transcription termination/antitermination protein NusG